MLYIVTQAIFTILAGVSSQAPTVDFAPGGDLFGLSVLSYTDCNNDKVPDLVVSDPLPSSENRSGRLLFLSGTNGEMLREFYSDRNAEVLGYRLATVSDQDGDALPELVVVARQSLSSQSSRVFVLGTRAASILSTNVLSIGFPRTLGEHYCHLYSLDDINRDGISDFVIGQSASANDKVASIRAYSGKDCSLLWETRTSSSLTSVCDALCVGPDCDGDGYRDLVALQSDGDGACRLTTLGAKTGKPIRVVHLADIHASTANSLVFAPNARLGESHGSPGLILAAPGNAKRPSRVEIYCLPTLELANRWVNDLEHFGLSAAEIDADRASPPGIIVGVPGTSSAPSFLYKLDRSRSDPSLVFKLDAWQGSGFGQQVISVPDINGDGAPDIVVGEASVRGRGGVPGRVWAFSGKKLGTTLWKVTRPPNQQ